MVPRGSPLSWHVRTLEPRATADQPPAQCRDLVGVRVQAPQVVVDRGPQAVRAIGASSPISSYYDDNPNAHGMSPELMGYVRRAWEAEGRP